MARPTKAIDEEQFQELYRQYSERKISKVQIAKEMNISRPKLYKILKDKGLN